MHKQRLLIGHHGSSSVSGPSYRFGGSSHGGNSFSGGNGGSGTHQGAAGSSGSETGGQSIHHTGNSGGGGGSSPYIGGTGGSDFKGFLPSSDSQSDAKYEPTPLSTSYPLTTSSWSWNPKIVKKMITKVANYYADKAYGLCAAFCWCESSMWCSVLELLYLVMGPLKL